MTESLLSPETRKSQLQKQSDLRRIHRLKGTLLIWSIALVIFIIETFLLNGYFASLIFPFLPERVVYWLEYLLVAYTLSAVIFLGISIIYGAPDMFFTFSSMIPIEFSPRSKPTVRQCTANESHISRRSDKSWVEDYQFGTTSEKSFNNGNTSQRSPLHDTSLNNSEILAGFVSPSAGKTISNAKPVDSIHTREQLDRFLRKEAENSFIDVSSSSIVNSSFSYFNMLDLSGGERKPYQLSEKNVGEDKDNVSVLRLPTDRRVHLSPIGAPENDVEALAQLRTALLAAKEVKRTGGSPMLRRTDSVFDRRRRSSHSSPTPQLGSHSGGETEGGGTVDEIDLSKAEHKLRAWLVKSVLIPLRDQIKKVNMDLEKEHANPPLRIGVSSVEALKNALSSRESLRTTQLQFILPYLTAHTNQSYLVSRITELATDPFMVNYNWNTGGCECEEKATSINNRSTRRRWHDGLPTDAELVFSLFSTFMDYQLTSNPLVGTFALDQPFSALYTLKSPNKPAPAHCAPGSFYLHMSSTSPPHFDFVYVTEGARIPMKTSVTKGSINLFQAILHFIHHAKTQNAGKIDMVSIGRTGLGIGSVLE